MANLKIVKLIREGDDGNIGSYPYYKVVDDVAVANPNLYNVTVGVDHGYDFQGDATCDMLVWDSNNEQLIHYPSYLSIYSMSCDFNGGGDNIKVLNEGSLDNIENDDLVKYQVFNRGQLVASSEHGDFYDTINMSASSFTVDYYGKYAIKDIDLGNMEGDGAIELFDPISAITKISDGMFSGCTDLTTVKLPYHIGNELSIGKYAFADCTSLECFYNYQTISEVGDYAFCNCTSLSGNELSCGVYSQCYKNYEDNFELVDGDRTTLKVNFDCLEYSFANCTSLTKIEFTENDIYLHDGCFSGCTNLQQVGINGTGKGISIPSNVYFECERDEPSSHTFFGATFANCIGVSGGSLTIQSHNGVDRFIPEECFLNCGLKASNGGGYPISDTTSIGDSAFKGCITDDGRIVENNGDAINFLANYIENVSDIDETELGRIFGY